MHSEVLTVQWLLAYFPWSGEGKGTLSSEEKSGVIQDRESIKDQLASEDAEGDEERPVTCFFGESFFDEGK